MRKRRRRRRTDPDGLNGLSRDPSVGQQDEGARQHRSDL